MKYKEIFKSWVFYGVVLISFIINVYLDLKTYGSLFIVEYIGIFIGTLLSIGLLASIGWLSYIFVSSLSMKVRKR